MRVIAARNVSAGQLLRARAQQPVHPPVYGTIWNTMWNTCTVWHQVHHCLRWHCPEPWQLRPDQDLPLFASHCLSLPVSGVQSEEGGVVPVALSLPSMTVAPPGIAQKLLLVLCLAAVPAVFFLRGSSRVVVVAMLLPPARSPPVSLTLHTGNHSVPPALLYMQSLPMQAQFAVEILERSSLCRMRGSWSPSGQ